jgi:hypothetical protein
VGGSERRDSYWDNSASVEISEYILLAGSVVYEN